MRKALSLLLAAAFAGAAMAQQAQPAKPEEHKQEQKQEHKQEHKKQHKQQHKKTHKKEHMKEEKKEGAAPAEQKK